MGTGVIQKKIQDINKFNFKNGTILTKTNEECPPTKLYKIAKYKVGKGQNKKWACLGLP